MLQGSLCDARKDLWIEIGLDSLLENVKTQEKGWCALGRSKVDTGGCSHSFGVALGLAFGFVAFLNQSTSMKAPVSLGPKQ